MLNFVATYQHSEVKGTRVNTNTIPMTCVKLQENFTYTCARMPDDVALSNDPGAEFKLIHSFLRTCASLQRTYVRFEL